MTNINPLIKWREDNDFTQKEAADFFGLSLTTVRQVESGTNSRLPATIADLTDITQVAYVDWKKSCRRAVGESLSGAWPKPVNVPPFNNAFGILIYGLGYASVHAFALDFKVRNRPVMQYLVNGGDRVPREVKIALIDAGYPYIKELEKEVKSFHV